MRVLCTSCRERQDIGKNRFLHGKNKRSGGVCVTCYWEKGVREDDEHEPTYRHLVECRNCGARYTFDNKSKTRKGYTNSVPCDACGQTAPHTVIAVAELACINIDDLEARI